MEEKVEHTRNHSVGIIKVVLFGPESTGKTTLAEQLADHYQTLWVPEYMRQFLEEKWEKNRQLITKEDLLPISHGQLRQEEIASKKVENLLICDTNILELKVYSEYYYDGYCPEFIEREVMNLSIKAEKIVDIYLLTYVDTPWEEDILRDRPNNREEMFSIFEAELKKQKFPFKILKGNLEERFDKAVEIIDSLLKTKSFL